MKLEDQFATPDQCKRLKELGVPQNAFFSWIWSPSANSYALSYEKVNDLELLASAYPKSKEWAERISKGIFSCWSVAELGMINKEDIRTYRTDGYWCAYIPTEEGFRLYENYFKTEAELRADILIKSLES